MRVLVTRPAQTAARTAAALAAQGIEAVLGPLADIVPTGATWPSGVIDALVATSGQAFASLALEPEHPRPETRRLLPLFCVGGRTAAAAAAAGFDGRALVAPDAEHLVDIARQVLEPKSRLLYLAGHDRKPLLETALPALGHNVEVLEIYDARVVRQMDPHVAAGLADGSIDAVLHYSRRSANLFRDMAATAGVDPSGVLHICISDDAAAPLFAARYHRIAIAAEPEEAAMIALLAAFVPQPGTAKTASGTPAPSR